MGSPPAPHPPPTGAGSGGTAARLGLLLTSPTTLETESTPFKRTIRPLYLGVLKGPHRRFVFCWPLSIIKWRAVPKAIH